MITSPLSAARFGSTFVLKNPPIEQLGEAIFRAMRQEPNGIRLNAASLDIPAGDGDLSTVIIPNTNGSLEGDRAFAVTAYRNGLQLVSVSGPFAASPDASDQRLILDLKG
ncbi:MAG: hypothetical protein IPK79_08230 [Vampirovibrionales bacterium]|nr:hypothetical protein [Vampirovibrionales bacterium]